MVTFLKDYWSSIVAMGERKLWFSGVVFLLTLCTVWLYAIYQSMGDIPTDFIKHWAVVMLLVGVIIPMMAAVVTGYIRNKLGLPSIKNNQFTINNYSDSRITGLIWLANTAGVFIIIVLPMLVYDFLLNT